jgi:hypothetical protein
MMGITDHPAVASADRRQRTLWGLNVGVDEQNRIFNVAFGCLAWVDNVLCEGKGGIWILMLCIRSSSRLSVPSRRTLVDSWGLHCPSFDCSAK